jgi:hypothetical protein
MRSRTTRLRDVPPAGCERTQSNVQTGSRVVASMIQPVSYVRLRDASPTMYTTTSTAGSDVAPPERNDVYSPSGQFRI